VSTSRQATVRTVRLVGSFEVDGLKSSGPGGQEARLLRRLAVAHDQNVSMPTLIDALWPSAPPARADRNVAALVSRLRRLLGAEALRGDSRGYTLVTSETLRVDLAEAEARLATAEEELAAASYGLAEHAAATAVTLLQAGPVLADEPESAWVNQTRTMADRLLRRARSLHWTAALACADYPAAEGSASAALDEDPLDEDACRALMTSYAQSGRPAAALQVYERLRTTLADALGIDPAGATQSLYLAILHTDLPPAPPPAVGGGHGGDSQLVSREAEIDALIGHWSSTVSGHGGLSLVLGTVGVGKRVLMDYLVTRAQASGGQVLRTACRESERSLFLQPLVDVIRPVLLARPPAEVRELLREWAAPLTDLIPDITAILGPVEYEHYLPETHQRRVFESLAGVLLGLARQAPVLLVVESLHNTSASTLEALRFLAGRAESHRLLIVGTGLASDAHRITAALGDATRIVEPREFDLTGVAAYLALHGSTLDPQRMLELTNGSPLYLAELVRHGQTIHAEDADAIPLPDSLRSAITARLGVVAPEVVEVLQLGAVFGDKFTLDEVSGLGQMRVEDCAARLQAALRAQLLIAHRVSFGFSNTILREVLYRQIPEPTRINRHRRAAELLAGQPEAAARHWVAAGAWPEAVVAWRLAGESAHRALSNAEAERLLGSAVQAAEHCDDPPTLADTLLRRGQILSELGRYQDAHDDQQRALEIARSLLDDAMEARALEQLGWTALFARDAMTAADLAARATRLAEAAAAAPGAPRSAALLLGRVRHWDGDYRGAAEAYEQVISERPDDEIAAQALTFRGAVLQHVDRFDEARRTLAQAIILCRSNGLFRSLLQSLFFTALSLGDTGDFDGALRSLQRARKLIDDHGTDYYSAGIDTTTSWLLRELGEHQRAREVAERAVASAERGGGALELEQGLHAVLALAECELVQGDIESAGDRVERAFAFLEVPLPFRARAHMRLLEMQARFEPARAEELLDLARASSSRKYQALALAHLGSVEEAAQTAAALGSDQLLAQVGAEQEAWAAILRLADTLPVERRARFLAEGRLPVHWRARTGRVG
jgi:DNA-binding SARP family transcriptional activator/tetratricopeptide (TPR) repeat protein